LPMCSLDEPDMREQRARYARIGHSVMSLDRRADVIELNLSADFDQRTLDELIKVEAECCPFFRFALDEARARLEIGVVDPEMIPALEAFAEEWAGGPQVAG